MFDQLAGNSTGVGDITQEPFEPLLELKHFALQLNLFQGNELAFAAARADFAGLPPCFFVTKIRVPKRPGFALPGASAVNRAFASFTIEEHAIAVGEFDQRFANAHLSNVLLFERFDGHPLRHRQGCYFFLVHPNEARRTGATIAALRA